MIKAIFYKEWIKTRWFLLVSFLTLLSFTGFCLIKLSRIIGLKGGAAHFWEVMIQRDVVFIELLQYIPLLIGVVWAIVQFVPEVQRKSLKLTLHLPFSQLKMTMAMLISGFVLLLSSFLVNLLIITLFFNHYFASELVVQVLLTAAPWFLAGLAGYLLTSWICLEPTWRMRILNSVVSLFLLRILFLSGLPGSYAGFLPTITLFIIFFFALSWISIMRFKEGKQD